MEVVTGGSMAVMADQDSTDRLDALGRVESLTADLARARAEVERLMEAQTAAMVDAYSAEATWPQIAKAAAMSTMAVSKRMARVGVELTRRPDRASAR